jgi:hypothetical protein
MNERRPVRVHKSGLQTWGWIFLIAVSLALLFPVVYAIGVIAYVSYDQAH